MNTTKEKNITVSKSTSFMCDEQGWPYTDFKISIFEALFFFQIKHENLEYRLNLPCILNSEAEK